jgi:hypothetical protein
VSGRRNYPRGVSAQPSAPASSPLAALRRPTVWWPLAAAAAANVGVGLAVAHRPSLGLLVATLPIVVLLAGWLALTRRELCVFVPLLVGICLGHVTRLPTPGSSAIFLTDIFVALAFAGWVVSRLGARERTPAWPRTPVLGWPYAFLALTLLVGVVRGHERYGTKYISQPTRFLIYAGIAGAVVSLTAKQALAGLTFVFYSGTVFQTLLALFHLATGTAATRSGSSTGGTREIALGSAMYLAAALVLALLNLERDYQTSRRRLHLTVAVLATLDIALSLGRTTFVAAGVLVPVLLLALHHTRRTILRILPLAVPVLLLFAVVDSALGAPAISEVAHRLTGHLSNDNSVVTRRNEYKAMVAGVGREPWFGVGFGRINSFVTDDGHVATSSGDLENSYLWILAGGGGLALGATILWLLAFFADAFRRRRWEGPEGRAVVLFSMSFVFILALNTFTGPIFSDPTFATTLWIVALLPSIVRKPAERPAQRR